MFNEDLKQKPRFFIAIGLLSIILCFNLLSSLNIAKLGLSDIELSNHLTETVTLIITFGKKCPDCPRLHGTFTKTYSIPAQGSITISDPPHIIQNYNINTGQLTYASCHGNCHNAFVITQNVLQEAPVPNFHEMLENDDEYKFLKKNNAKYLKSMPSNVSPENFFDKLESLYNRNKQKLCALDQMRSMNTNNDQPSSIQQRIPRIIHTCWFGSHKLPDLYHKWLDEWKKNHPGWALMIWNEEMIEHKFKGALHNQKIYNEAKEMYDYATMSKLARYEILNSFGGLYIDPDIRSFESIAHLHQQYDFYAGLGSFKSYGACNNAIIGSKPNHPILKQAMALIKKSETKAGGLYDWTAKNLGHKIFTQAVYDRLGHESYTDIIFPKTFFSAVNLENDFCHPDPIYQAEYAHLKHEPESLCCRGSYSTVP